MSTEELIKEAVSLQMDEAPGRAELLAGMRRAEQARTARRWRRRGVLVLAVAGVVVAAVASTVIVRDTGLFGPPVTSQSDCPSSEPPAEGQSEFPMRYSPTWLPDGSTEVSRTAPAGAADPEGHDGVLVTREWLGPPTGTARTSLRLTVRRSAEATPPPGRPVDIDGTAGVVDNKGAVWWQPTPDETLTVSAVSAVSADTAETALRVARSVVPDLCPTLRSVVEVGWLPDEMRPGLQRVTSTPSLGMWRSTDLWFIAVGAYVSDIRISIQRGQPEGTARDREVSVRGTVGTYREEDLGQGENVSATLSVDLGDGRTLVVTYGRLLADDAPLVTEEELIRVADELIIWPTPDYDWIGTN